jgi:hypothetical protein
MLSLPAVPTMLPAGIGVGVGVGLGVGDGVVPLSTAMSDATTVAGAAPLLTS